MESSFAFTDWWEALTTAEQVFWGMGAVGTVILVLQTVLSFVGMDADLDMDIDAEISLDFSLFSFKSFMAFVTFFGWMGVIGLGRGWSIPLTIVAATVAGLAAMSLVAYMLFQFQKLESSGNMRIEEALLQEGDVYLKIPPAAAGTGQISLELGGQIRELQAMTKGDSLPTGSKVKVVDILEGNILLVEPVKMLDEGEDSNSIDNQS